MRRQPHQLRIEQAPDTQRTATVFGLANSTAAGTPPSAPKQLSRSCASNRSRTSVTRAIGTALSRFHSPFPPARYRAVHVAEGVPTVRRRAVHSMFITETQRSRNDSYTVLRAAPVTLHFGCSRATHRISLEVFISMSPRHTLRLAGAIALFSFSVAAAPAFADPGNGNDCGKHPTNPACTVDPPAVNATPELDSLVLFGTGVLGAGGYALTRFRALRRQDEVAQSSTT
jgi:hypothetical protein